MIIQCLIASPLFSGDVSIPLKAVHVRARLHDLASEVIVLQSYTNESEEPIEVYIIILSI